MIWTTQRNDDWFRQELENLFSAFQGGISVLPEGDYPRVNIYSNDDEMVLTAHLPGIEASSLEITCKDDTVSIKGVRRTEMLGEGQSYLRQERGAGEFVRAFSLPYGIDTQRVEATYKDGVLRIRLPRQATAKPRKIVVSAA